MNPSTALAVTLVDELIRCGLREAVLAPGSRSAPLAMELHRRARAGDLRLHVRIDERSAAFTALGLAKASRAPVAVACTSGTAAAHFHAAVIEAGESGVPLVVLTADRPPELRGTGANQAIDQLRLYGPAARWFCEVGVPEAGEPLASYWRSVASRAVGVATGSAGGPPGPVHLNLALREPLVPDASDGGDADGADRAGGAGGAGELAGRPGGAAWTSFGDVVALPRTERGLVVCGDGDYPAEPLLELAEAAGWPVLAEPSSNARRGPNALAAYQYLLADPGFMAAHRSDVIISAGRPGLSRGQLALLRLGGSASAGPAAAIPGAPWPEVTRSEAAGHEAAGHEAAGHEAAGHAGMVRHVVIAQGPGRWSDPARSATDVAARVRLAGRPASGGSVGDWLGSWTRADQAVRRAVDAVLDANDRLSEPRLARDLVAALPDGALLWAASSLPVRDLDQHAAPRAGLRILASRGASGIDGLVSSAIGAALAHQAAGGGQAVALLGDLALLHDAPGLLLGPDEPRPELCLIVVNNDGGGIFSMLEQAAFPGSFERVFGTPHGTRLGELAAAAGLPFRRIESAADLMAELPELSVPGRGLRLLELRTDRSGQAALRASLTRAAAGALAALGC